MKEFEDAKNQDKVDLFLKIKKLFALDDFVYKVEFETAINIIMDLGYSMEEANRCYSQLILQKTQKRG